MTSDRVQLQFAFITTTPSKDAAVQNSAIIRMPITMQCYRDLRADKVTKPKISIKAPLTPPPPELDPTEPVLEIFKLIREYERGRPILEFGWHAFKLPHREYHHLLSLLKNEESLWIFVENKLRCA